MILLILLCHFRHSHIFNACMLCADSKKIGKILDSRLAVHQLCIKPASYIMAAVGARACVCAAIFLLQILHPCSEFLLELFRFTFVYFSLSNFIYNFCSGTFCFCADIHLVFCFCWKSSSLLRFLYFGVLCLVPWLVACNVCHGCCYAGDKFIMKMRIWQRQRTTIQSWMSAAAAAAAEEWVLHINCVAVINLFFRKLCWCFGGMTAASLWCSVGAQFLLGLSFAFEFALLLAHRQSQQRDRWHRLALNDLVFYFYIWMAA